MTSFKTRQTAYRYFKDVDVEECECCGGWSASRADHVDGDIVGPYCVEEGDKTLFDRVCRRCSESEICTNCFQIMAPIENGDGRITHYICGMCGRIQKE